MDRGEECWLSADNGVVAGSNPAGGRKATVAQSGRAPIIRCSVLPRSIFTVIVDHV